MAGMATRGAEERSAVVSPVKALLYRALLALFSMGVALGLGLWLLDAAEGGGWFQEIGPPPHFRPLEWPVGSARLDEHGRPLFGVDPNMGAQVGEPNLGRYWMTKAKAPGVFRILSIGESTTFGAGYAPVASYSRFLEARLRRRLARDTLEVVNCGKNGYDSHDWPTLAEELPAFAPDLLVLYVGHNELKKPNLLGVVDPLKATIARSRRLQRLLGTPKDELSVPPTVTIGSFLTPEQRQRACDLFEAGVGALLRVARELAIPVVVCIPSSNVLDHLPRLSIVQPGRDAAAQVARIETVAREFELGALPDLAASAGDAEPRARVQLELGEIDAALAVDGEAAILHFRRGRLLLALGRIDEARAAFARSLGLDGLPERASPDLIQVLRDLAVRERVVVADIEARFMAESARGVPGSDLFYDYCHPKLFGHWLIADEILKVIEASGVVASASEFVDAREPAGSSRERFSIGCAELGMSEADGAKRLVEQAKANVGQLGTLPEVAREQWRIPAELLDAAESMEPAERTDATFLLLRGLIQAGFDHGDDARVALLAAGAADRELVSHLVGLIATLPGLVHALDCVGITIENGELCWHGKPSR